MASSSASSPLDPPPKWNYDVFLSFRGEETRRNFVDHLYTALHDRGIHTFKDDEILERGKSIGPELVKNIEESRFAVVIFSKNYGSSSWCLDELAKIVECSQTKGLTVLPIFYNVDPSDVRKQKGEFGEAFSRHESDKVEEWKEALKQATQISGWDLQHTADGHESKFIKAIVKHISSKLETKAFHVADYVVGVDSRVKEVEMLLEKGSDDVRIVGICGIGGIGKSTIAKDIFNSMFGQFDGSCLLSKVREISKKHGFAYLQEELLREILNTNDIKISNPDRGMNMIKERLRYKKVLVVLDDVDQVDQLKNLVGTRDWFGAGSRIIITTRDRHCLNEHKVDEIYMARLLDKVEALQLFSWHAFGQDHPIEDYMKQSYRVIYYAKGLPLALVVLGSLLCDKRCLPQWEGALDKLKMIPNRTIHDVLRLSIDGLDDTEKDIFLDIACFFKGEDKDYVTDVLKSCGFYPEIGLTVLIDKSLITVEGSRLSMHDLIQKMGLEIVREESKYLGECSRLWFHEDIFEVLSKNLGTKKVEGIALNLFEPKEINVRTEAFTTMNRLRLLKIHNVCIPQHPKYISTELRLLDWYRFPSNSLPPSFEANKLVSLKMCYSRIIEVWKGKQMLNNLKYMDLSHSQKLVRTPDLTEAPNLVELILEGCTSLREVHPSVGLLQRIALINLKGCENLRRFPNGIHSKSLKIFVLSGCLKLETFPDILVDMEHLLEVDLDGASIKDLPPSIKNLTSLVRINLSNCKNLRSLPSTFFMLKRQKTLLLSGCSKFDKLPDGLSYLECLEEIHVDGTAIRELPSSIGHLTSLVLINLRNCKYLTGLPSTICNVKSLKNLILSGCSRLDKLPDNLGCLECLQELCFNETAIKGLPLSFERLTMLVQINLRNCKNLTTLPSTVSMLRCLKNLILSGCSKLDRLPTDIGTLECLEELRVDGTAITQPPPSISLLKNLMVLSFSGCKGTSLLSSFRRKQGSVGLVLPPLSGLCSLRELDISYCNLLELPNDLGCLSSLLYLYLEGNNFVNIPATSLNQLSRLEELSLVGCEKLEKLPQLPSSIRYLYMDNCTSLRSFPDMLFTKGEYLRTVSFVNCPQLLENQRSKYNGSILLEPLLQRLKFIPYSCIIHFPGRDIPKWFSNQIMDHSISVRLPPNLDNHKRVGFVVCVIFSSMVGLPRWWEVHTSKVATMEVIVNGRGSTSYWHIGTNKIFDSQHVCLAYKRPLYEMPRAGGEIKVSVCGCDEDMVVKKLGIRPVYEYEDMEGTIYFE